MKKIISLIILVIILAGCVTTEDPAVILEDISWEMAESLAEYDGYTLAVYPFNSPDEDDGELIEYIRQILTTGIANASAEMDSGIGVLSRRNLDQLLEEQAFQLSDIADEESQIEIGAILGAELIVTGDLNWTGENTTALNIQIIETETAIVIGGWIAELSWED